MDISLVNGGPCSCERPLILGTGSCQRLTALNQWLDGGIQHVLLIRPFTSFQEPTDLVEYKAWEFLTLVQWLEIIVVAQFLVQGFPTQTNLYQLETITVLEVGGVLCANICPQIFTFDSCRGPLGCLKKLGC